MKFFKKVMIITSSFFVLFLNTKAFAMHDLSNLMQQLELAKERLSIAERALKMNDFDAFTVYKKYPYMPESLYAEIHLRNAYPKEYSEYIQAKGDLDDIEFMVYTAKLNTISLLYDSE